MPLYMVIPSLYKARYRGYWVDVGGDKVLCLVEAPSAATPKAVHREGQIQRRNTRSPR